nr:hypothetical protein [Halocynthiibacter namhaensis]
MFAVEWAVITISGHDNGIRLLAFFHTLPKVIIDNPKFGNLGDGPVFFRLDARDTASRLWVFLVLSSPVHQPPNISFVVQKSRTAITLTANGGILPNSPLWPFNTFHIEGLGNRTGTDTIGEHIEDAVHDQCLLWINRAFTGATDNITVSYTASCLAIKYTATLTTLYLISEITDVLFSHHTHHGNQHFIDFALMNGEESNA